MIYLNKNTIYVGECDSTNDVALWLLRNVESCVFNLTKIIASSQTKGRGQVLSDGSYGKWLGDKYKNIMLSIVIDVDLNVDNFFLLSVMTSLAIQDALGGLLGDKLSIKWPNDVYYDDKKLGGILIENIIRGGKIKKSIVGIGLNVNQGVFNGVSNATSISIIKGEDQDLFHIMRLLLTSFYKRYNQVQVNKLENISLEYEKYLYKRGVNQLFCAENDLFYGKIKGIDNLGRLIVCKNSGDCRAYSSKQIKIIYTS
jgi:BirA family biotin operon repressor/biotin-[acetyl-CoA-carboxylase] ligase